MVDEVLDGARSPVLIELCLLLRQFFGDDLSAETLGGMKDEDLYRHIVFVGSLRHSREEFTARRAPELDLMAPLVLDRVRTSALGDGTLRSPQARFGAAVEPRVRDDRWEAHDDKPVGGLWTSSFLPGGGSMWQWGESAEFGAGRTMGAVAFDPGSVRVFTIDSPADYELLVRQYPRSADGRTRVAWTAAAEDFHAVHLTVHGMLTAQYVPFRTPEGTAVLSGWDAESTVWLQSPDPMTERR